MTVHWHGREGGKGTQKVGEGKGNGMTIPGLVCGRDGGPGNVGPSWSLVVGACGCVYSVVGLFLTCLALSGEDPLWAGRGGAPLAPYISKR